MYVCIYLLVFMYIDVYVCAIDIYNRKYVEISISKTV